MTQSADTNHPPPPPQQIFPGTPPQATNPQIPASNLNNQANSFCLKWLFGTTVSRCYGCSTIIQNPPASIDEALIVVYRDRRLFVFY